MAGGATSAPDRAAARVDGATWVALAALTILAAELRLPHLGTESLDKLSSLFEHTGATFAQIFLERTPAAHIPGYWLLMRAWIALFGDSEAALRLPSALFGIATVPAMFALGRRWYGAREGLIAAGITVVAWMPVNYSQEARQYALLLLAVVASTAWLIDVVVALRHGATPTRGARFGYLCAAGVAAYSSYFGVVAVLLQASVAGLLLVRRRRALAALIMLHGGVLLIVLPLCYRARFRPPEGGTWLTAPTPRSFWDLLCFDFNQSDGIAALVLAIWALALARTLARGAGFARQTLLLAVWLVVPAVSVYVYSQWAARPAFLERGLIVLVPAAYLLLARALTRLPAACVTAPSPMALLLVHLVVVCHYYTRPVKEQFREAAAYLIAHDTAETPALVFACAFRPFYFDHYLARQGSPRRVERLVEAVNDIPIVRTLIAARRPRRLAARRPQGARAGAPRRAGERPDAGRPTAAGAGARLALPHQGVAFGCQPSAFSRQPSESQRVANAGGAEGGNRLATRTSPR